MTARGLVFVGLASLLMSNVCYAKTAKTMGDIFKARCANCHGVKANGIPKLKEQPGVSAEEAPGEGAASQEKANIYGPPLNAMSREDLLSKLKDLRNKDYDSQSYHSVMQKNLKKVEEREGKISDEKMADYIYTSFGPGAK